MTSSNHELPQPLSGVSEENQLTAQLFQYLEHINGALRRTYWLISVAVAIEKNPNILGDAIETDANNVFARTGSAEHEDILRAAVILTHAYLEDFLRMLGRRLLPLASKEVLDQIPLAGTSGRVQKFFLGSLKRHIDKAVEQVVQESVDEYLDKYTFNNSTEVVEFIENLGIKVDSDLTTVNQMMRRRHQIAHRADRLLSETSEIYEIQPISPVDVANWVTATTAFIEHVVRSAIEQKIAPESHLRNYFKSSEGDR